MFSTHEMKYIWYLAKKRANFCLFYTIHRLFLFTRQAVKMQKKKQKKNKKTKNKKKKKKKKKKTFGTTLFLTF